MTYHELWTVFIDDTFDDSCSAATSTWVTTRLPVFNFPPKNVNYWISKWMHQCTFQWLKNLLRLKNELIMLWLTLLGKLPSYMGPFLMSVSATNCKGHLPQWPLWGCSDKRIWPSCSHHHMVQSNGTELLRPRQRYRPCTAHWGLHKRHKSPLFCQSPQ